LFYKLDPFYPCQTLTLFILDCLLLTCSYAGNGLCSKMLDIHICVCVQFVECGLYLGINDAGLQEGRDLLQGLCHVETNIGNGISGKQENCGQQQLGGDICAADLCQNI